MVFKRSAFVLLAVTAAALATTEAKTTEVTVESHLKHPVLKSHKVKHGKVTATFVEGHTRAHSKYAVNMPSAKNLKHTNKKAHGKQISEKKNGNEVEKKFPHGKVVYVTNDKAAADAKPAHKKTHKKVVKQAETPKPTEKPTEAPGSDSDESVENDEAGEEGAADEGANEEGELEDSEDSEDVEEKDFQLKVGETVDIEIEGEKYTLEHFANGSTVIKYPNGTQEWVDNKDIYLDFEVDEDESTEDGGPMTVGTHEAGSAAGSKKADPAVGQESGVVKEIEDDVSSVAKKFSELATKLTGHNMKEAAPVIIIGGAIGALAAVVGIAAIAIGRARSNSAAADPQSVLADATEDVEADVEAAATEEKKEDEAADESQALDSSDSESESETEQEEGKFTNEVASV